jgi:hypothetical protein
MTTSMSPRRPLSPALLLPFVATLAACTRRHPEAAHPTEPAGDPSTSAIAARLGDTVRVLRGQEVAVDGRKITLRFDSTGADSRCRAGVQCVWAGDVAAMFTLTTIGTTATPTLHTGLEPRRSTVGGYVVELVAIDPYPGTEPPNARLAQSARLVVTRP